MILTQRKLYLYGMPLSRGDVSNIWTLFALQLYRFGEFSNFCRLVNLLLSIPSGSCFHSKCGDYSQINAQLNWIEPRVSATGALPKCARRFHVLKLRLILFSLFRCLSWYKEHSGIRLFGNSTMIFAIQCVPCFINI